LKQTFAINLPDKQLGYGLGLCCLKPFSTIFQ